MKHAHLPLIVAAALLLVACGQRDDPTGADADGMPHRHGHMHGDGDGKMMDRDEMMRMCPMQVPGASVAVADVDGGVAVRYRSDQADQVEDLRGRVRRMAERHRTMHQRHAQHDGAAEGGRMMMMPPATATVEEIPQGARVVLRPQDAGDLADLRRHARKHAKRAEKMEGGCPMMGMMGTRRGMAGDDQGAAAAEDEAPTTGDEHEQHH